MSVVKKIASLPLFVSSFALIMMAALTGPNGFQNKPINSFQIGASIGSIVSSCTALSLLLSD
jgi:hypothetical protein